MFLASLIAFQICGIASAKTKNPSSGWDGRLVSDKMTDESNYILTVDSIEPVLQKKRATLSVVINCSEDSMNLALLHPFVTKSELVTIRLDKEKPFKAYGVEGGGGQAISILNEKLEENSGEEIISKIYAHKKFLIQYHDAADTPVEAEFNVSGLKEKIEKGCGKK